MALIKLVAFVGVISAAFAQDASFKANGDNLKVAAPGTVTMTATNGASLAVSPTEITMTTTDNTKTLTQLKQDLDALTAMNGQLNTTLSNLKANYSDTQDELTTMQGTFSLRNQQYSQNLTNYKTLMETWRTETVIVTRSAFRQAVIAFNTSDTGTNRLVGTLLSRYNDLVDARSNGRRTAIGVVNEAVAEATAVLNSARADVNGLDASGRSAVTQLNAAVVAATKVLTDAMTDAQDELATGNAAVARSATSITDLASTIRTRLGSKIDAVNTASATIDTNFKALIDDLDDTFLSLESSMQRLRAFINSDFPKITEIQFTPPQVDLTDYFGETADWSGDTVIAGADGFNGIAPPTSSYRPGGAFIFTYNQSNSSFVLEGIMEGENTSDSFGAAVAIEGDTALVGAPFWEPARVGTVSQFSVGRAYVFKKMDGVWTKTQTLDAPDANNGDQFGRSVAMAGDWLVVSAPYHEIENDAGVASALSTGLLYVYRRATPNDDYVFSQSLQAPGAKAYDSLALQAYSLDMTENQIIAGASNADGSTTTGGTLSSSGKAFVWSLLSLPGAGGVPDVRWSLDGTLEPPTIEAGSADYFGYATSACQRADGRQFVAAGAYGDDGAGNAYASSTGAVYLYSRPGAGGAWSDATVIRDPDVTASLSFGIDLAFNDACSQIAIGSNANSYTGAIYVYTVDSAGTGTAVSTSASFLERLQAPSAATSDYAGRGLVWGSNYVGTGAYYNDVQGTSSGTFFALSKDLVI